MVHLVVETKVKKFDEDVSSVAKDAAKKSLLKLNDMDIETIYSSTLQIKAYFDLLHSICLMYTNIHVQHVETGLALVNELSKVSRSPEEMRPKREALDKFTDNAQKAIMKIVGDVSPKSKSRVQDLVANESGRNNGKSPTASKSVSRTLRSRRRCCTRRVCRCRLRASWQP